jgi:acetylornithine deacetylase/succinyl-diaminopimelate desuccinylase-like protein
VNDVVSRLQHLIQLDSTNPPGNELLVARYLDGVLRGAGIDTTVLETAPGRGALIARLRGSGAAAPLLLTAHMDVVGVEAASWTSEPFGGEIRDGYVYGRGAIDDKGMLACELEAVLRLKREMDAGRITLDRDVIFAATPDEESGGELGLSWIIDRHPDLIRAEYALNEGGRIRIVDGEPLYAAVQTTEKVSHVVTVKATGPGGHASIPLEGNAVARLAHALAAITTHQEPVKLIPTVREFFTRLSAVWPEPDVAQAMRDSASNDEPAVQRGCSALCKLPLYNAVLRTGISATVIRAGVRHNVIPTEAEATLSVRTLPGDSIDDLLARLGAIVADGAVTIAIESRGLGAPVSDHASLMFEAIRGAVTALDPAIITVPYMSTGATESAHLRAWGVQTFGLLPFPLNADDESRMHGHDERVATAALEFGAQLVFDIARRVAGRRSNGAPDTDSR